MRRLSRYALRVAIAIDIYLAISIARDVANVTTTRLYLSGRTDAAPASDASERFDIEGSRVVPNRLAQNRLMRHFCDEAGIRFMDTTEVLAERLQSGVNVYFPDDSHLNEAGQAVVAAALRDFLARAAILSPTSALLAKRE